MFVITIYKVHRVDLFYRELKRFFIAYIAFNSRVVVLTPLRVS